MNSIRHKYIEEEFPRWFVLEDESCEGLVDLNDGNDDIVTSITRREAKRLIAERDKVVDELIRLYNIADIYEGWRKRPSMRKSNDS